MRSVEAAATRSHRDRPGSRRRVVRLLGIVPALLLLSGLLAVLAGPLAASAAASAPAGVVVAWGHPNHGETEVPAGLSDVTAIAAGGYHSLALKSDGTVVAWGANIWGQTDVPAGLSGVTAIAAGWGHSLALKSDGTVVAWGRDPDLGAANATVPAGLSGVIAIAAGYNSLALKSDGTVVAWGDNSFGQTTIPAGLSGVIAIAAGGFHNLALVAAPTVSPITGSTYHAISPARLLDTRSGNGLSGPFNANSPRTFGVTGRAGIPAGATAVTGNITAVDETAGWAVYLGPDPTASPGSSTINFGAGEVIGNGLTVALRADGTLSATYMSSSGNTTDLVFDVTGYFVPALWDM